MIWWALVVVLVLVTLLARRRPGRDSNVDLGKLSDSWLMDRRTGRQDAGRGDS